jgi:hypothetical protein
MKEVYYITGEVKKLKEPFSHIPITWVYRWVISGVRQCRYSTAMKELIGSYYFEN